MAAVIRPIIESADVWRNAGAPTLAVALIQGQQQLLGLFDGFEEALGPQGLHVAYDPVLNLPLWELGHIAWFEEFWLARNPGRSRGPACDPGLPRNDPLLSGADAFYDSSKVAHLQRWHLRLPDSATTRAYAANVHAATLRLLHDSAGDDDTLYFFRLVLFHQAMHIEAWHFMAQQLGIDLGPAMGGRAPRVPAGGGEWRLSAAQHRLGSAGPGFVFDNERVAHAVSVASFAIDRAPVTWTRFLRFVDAGGYDEARWWSPAGWQWRQHQAAAHPRHLRRAGGAWQQHRFGVWVPLDAAEPALHISAFEAEAWCRWAGRRLPAEAEWELAAIRAAEQGEAFDWGQVWEWTASPFTAYPGFEAHPYRDYSQPWFDGRPVLRGASFATPPVLRHPRLRNFFPPGRNDVFAGFRSCAIG